MKWKIILLLAIGLIIWLVLSKEMGWWLDSGEVIYKIGLGIGAILGGFSAIPIIRDWVNDRGKKMNKEKMMRKFSARTRDKKKIEIWKQQDGDPIYAVELRKNLKHHIKPWSTFKELGYPDDGWDKEVKLADLNKLDPGEDINFDN
jgi:hypothetical protein